MQIYVRSIVKKVLLILLAIVVFLYSVLVSYSFMEGKYIPRKTTKRAFSKTIVISNIFYFGTISNEIKAILIPGATTIDNKVYQLNLYLQGELIGTTKISWNKDELKTIKPKEADFETNTTVNSNDNRLLYIKINE
jgi:hypothetical protein